MPDPTPAPCLTEGLVSFYRQSRLVCLCRGLSLPHISRSLALKFVAGSAAVYG
ncbi:MAG: hypothetical protein ACOYCD_03020 [Kiritimatiellia bacterium]